MMEAEDDEKAQTQSAAKAVSKAEAIQRTTTLLEAVTEDVENDEEAPDEEELDEAEQRLLEVNKIIKRKSIQVAIATLTASSGTNIPGVGTVAAVVFGVAASAGITLKLQTDMVQEISRVYGEDLDSDSVQKVMAVLAGLSRGVSLASTAAKTKVAMSATGNRIAAQVTKSKFAGYIPLVGPVAMASMNMASTYVIGQRAQVYFEKGEDGMATWEDSVRAISGVDERKLIAWMKEAIQKVSTGVVQAVKGGGFAVFNSIATGGKTVVSTVASGGKTVANTVNRTRRSVVAGMTGLLTPKSKEDES